MGLDEWRAVYERLPVERKDKSLAEISGFDKKYCADPQLFSKAVYEKLLAESGLASGTVCEVGCGCGDKLSLFYKSGFRCFGADFSEKMVERARQEMPGAGIFVAEANALPFGDKSMDFVFSYGVFLYFSNWNYAQHVLSEMCRIAKPGATICIEDVPDIKEKDNVENFRGKPEPGYEHLYYDMNDFIQWFKQRGALFVKADYTVRPVYKHSSYRFNITARLAPDEKGVSSAREAG